MVLFLGFCLVFVWFGVFFGGVCVCLFCLGIFCCIYVLFIRLKNFCTFTGLALGQSRITMSDDLGYHAEIHEFKL